MFLLLTRKENDYAIMKKGMQYFRSIYILTDFGHFLVYQPLEKKS